MDHRRKAILSAALGALWIGLVLWHWNAFEQPARVPLTNVSGLPPSGHGAKDDGGGLRVNMDRLAAANQQRDASFVTPKNIFALPGPDGSLPLNAEPIPSVDPLPPQNVAQQAAVLELGQYRYLGYLRLTKGQNRNNNMAVLSKNEEVVVAEVGDRVEQHLRLKAVTPDSVTIEDTGAQVEQTLLLSEEPPVQQ